MSINPGDDFDKISKVFKSFEEARQSFFKKNSSLGDALLSKLKGLVDKHILSPSGNSAVTEILDDLNSLKGKKLKDLTQDQDLVQIARSLTGQQKKLKPKSDFEVLKGLFDNFVKITLEKENNSKTLEESFFPPLDEAKKLLKSRNSKKALDTIKEELTRYSETKIEHIKPTTSIFDIIAEILRKHLVIYEDEGFVSYESTDDPTQYVSQLRWDSKEEALKSDKIFRSILISSFERIVSKAVEEGMCGNPKQIEVENVREGECKVRFKEEFKTDLFNTTMTKEEKALKINGRNYPVFSTFVSDHISAHRRKHLEINFNEDQASKTFIRDKKTLEKFILEAANFTGFNPQTGDHKMLFLALLNCTTQTNGNLFFTKFKGIMNSSNLEFMESFEKGYGKDLKESIQFIRNSPDSFKVSFEISDSFRLKMFPEQEPILVTSVRGSYSINLSGDAISLNNIDVEGRVFIPQ